MHQEAFVSVEIVTLARIKDNFKVPFYRRCRHNFRSSSNKHHKNHVIQNKTGYEFISVKKCTKQSSDGILDGIFNSYGKCASESTNQTK